MVLVITTILPLHVCLFGSIYITDANFPPTSLQQCNMHVLVLLIFNKVLFYPWWHFWILCLYVCMGGGGGELRGMRSSIQALPLMVDGGSVGWHAGPNITVGAIIGAIIVCYYILTH